MIDENYDIEKHINYQTNELLCGICNHWFKTKDKSQFKNLISKAKRLKRIFYCSDECRRIGKGSLKLICDNCNKEFFIKKTAKKEHNFCCRKCWKEFLKKNITTLLGSERKCSYCNKTFIVGKNGKGKYCSNECQHKDILKHYAELIEQGINVSHRVLRAYFIRHYGRCMNPNCKWDWDNNNENNPVLELHHIDGNHKNNTLDNCILLCPNCHSLTDNYKFKECHKSTRDRKKYYKKE